jgi:26S proteasome regulatory subunit T3
LYKVQKEAENEEDLYFKLKELENQLELLNIQEEYIRDEQRQLKSEYIRSKEEVSQTFC